MKEKTKVVIGTIFIVMGIALMGTAFEILMRLDGVGSWSAAVAARVAAVASVGLLFIFCLLGGAYVEYKGLKTVADAEVNS